MRALGVRRLKVADPSHRKLLWSKVTVGGLRKRRDEDPGSTVREASASNRHEVSKAD